MTLQKIKTFEYKPRDASAIRQRAAQGKFTGEGYLRQDAMMFVPKDGINTPRILPPTWEGARHYGYEVWLHYEIGPDKSKYLCLNKMKNEDCPICDERMEAEKEGDVNLVKKLKPTRRVLMWVINRKEENNGPSIFSCPPSVDTNFCKLSVDNKTGEVLCIDNPSDGYDIEFERLPAIGEGFPTYTGEKIDRNSSPIGDTEKSTKWLDYIVKNPIPSLLVYYTYEHIKKVFSGKKKVEEPFELPPKNEQPILSPKSEIKTEVAANKSLKESVKTNKDVNKLTRVDLEQLCVELGYVPEDIVDADDNSLRQAVCEGLNIEIVQEKNQPFAAVLIDNTTITGVGVKPPEGVLANVPSEKEAKLAALKEKLAGLKKQD